MAAQIQTPHVIITEQPRSKPVRFRYKCEGRSAGTIPGQGSGNEKKTYPSIKIVGYQGRAKVIVSCVTKDEPYRPHPHSLVGRDGCNNGICTLDMPPTTMSITFSNLGIQCARRRDVGQALYIRQNVVNIDPFNTGFDHQNDPASLDMNIVRLCFQVFIENAAGECIIPLTPVVSDPVNDIKAAGNLIICRLSECVSPVDGGKKDIYLLCKKVSKENIKVRLYEGDENNPTWEGYPNISPTQVHEQTAIWFRAPPYKNTDITEPVAVFIQLLRPSDGATSDSLPFQFLPIEAEAGMLKRKRQKFGNNPRRHLLLDLQEQLVGSSNYYNIPPTPEKFSNLHGNSGKPTLNHTETKFAFPADSRLPPMDAFANIFIPAQDDKIMNTDMMENNNYMPNFVQNYQASAMPYHNFVQPESATHSTYLNAHQNIASPPIYNNLYGNITDDQTKKTVEIPTSPSKLKPYTDMTRQISREKVNNAIRAKCRGKQQLANIPSVVAEHTYTNQVELRYGPMFTTETVLQGEQNNFGNSVTNPNLSSLLDVDFEQLHNLLVPTEEDQYNSLNIPMNAMTISDVSCNLSSLLNMDSTQLQTTISTDQLENLLAII